LTSVSRNFWTASRAEGVAQIVERDLVGLLAHPAETGALERTVEGLAQSVGVERFAQWTGEDEVVRRGEQLAPTEAVPPHASPRAL
jgi:hypothetical protein